MIKLSPLAVAQLFAFGVVARRLAGGATRASAVQPGALSEHERVSVVIPARNEAARIGPCIDGLLQSGAHEIIVVDDESTDATARVAKDAGATVIAGRPLPDGWVGKPWALQQGLLQCSGDVVVFLDADTVPRPGLLGALVGCLDSSDVVTLAPRFLTSDASEQALHASMLVTLVYRYGAVGDQRSVPPERIYGNGQCLAARRSWLTACGGFALAGSAMNDDIALLRALAARGARMQFLDGREVLDVRMHDDVQGVWREWGRSLPMNETTPLVQRVIDLAILWLLLIVPLRVFTGRRGNMIDVASLLMRMALNVGITPSYAGSRLGVYLSPLADVAAVARLTQATIRPVRTWRGRRYGQQENAARQVSSSRP